MRRFNTNNYSEEEEAYNLITALEELAELSKDCQLDEDFIKIYNEPISFICKKLGTTSNQAIFLSILAKSYNERFSLEEIGKYLGLRKLQILQQKDELDNLVQRRIVYPYFWRNEEMQYKLPYEVVESFLLYNDFAPRCEKNVDEKEFFRILETLFNRAEDDNLPFSYLNKEIDFLLTFNMDLAFSKAILESKLPKGERLILLYACHLFINENKTEFSENDILGTDGCKIELLSILRELKTENSILQFRNLIEKSPFCNFKKYPKFILTEEAKSKLFPELQEQSAFSTREFRRSRKKIARQKILLESRKQIWHKLFPKLRNKTIEEIASIYSPNLQNFSETLEAINEEKKTIQDPFAGWL